MKKISWVIFILFITLFIISCSQKQQKENIINIKVKKGNIINYIKTIGKVETSQEYIAIGDISGIAKKVFVKEGNVVKNGDYLLTFDPNSTNIKELEITLQGKETAWRQAIINHEQALREFNISEELYKINAEALLNFKTKKDNLDRSINILKQSEKELEYVRNEFKNKSEKLNYKAPQSGIIISAPIKEGMFISIGQHLFTIANTNNLQIRAEVDESDIGKIYTGQEVWIISDSISDKKFIGAINKIYPGATIKEKRAIIETIVKLKENNLPLKINSQVDVKIISDKKESVLIIPLSGVSWEKSNPFVWIKKQGKEEKLFIKTGVSDMDKIEVLSGIKEGEEIIIKNQNK